MTRRCNYPSCRQPATHTWALVPVCLHHRELIWKETLQYYSRRIMADDREHYRKIKRLTPWG